MYHIYHICLYSTHINMHNMNSQMYTPTKTTTKDKQTRFKPNHGASLQNPSRALRTLGQSSQNPGHKFSEPWAKVLRTL